MTPAEQIQAQAEALNKNSLNMSLAPPSTGSTFKDFLLQALSLGPMGMGARSPIPGGMPGVPKPPNMSTGMTSSHLYPSEAGNAIRPMPKYPFDPGKPANMSIGQPAENVQNINFNPTRAFNAMKNRTPDRVMQPVNDVHPFPEAGPSGDVLSLVMDNLKGLNLMKGQNFKPSMDTVIPKPSNTNPDSPRIQVKEVKDIAKQLGLRIKSDKAKGEDQTVYIKYEDMINPEIVAGKAQPTIRVPTDEASHIGRSPRLSEMDGLLLDLGLNYTRSGSPPVSALNKSGDKLGSWQNFMDALKWRTSRDPTGGNFLIPPDKAPASVIDSVKTVPSPGKIPADPNQLLLPFILESLRNGK